MCVECNAVLFCYDRHQDSTHHLQFVLPFTEFANLQWQVFCHEWQANDKNALSGFVLFLYELPLNIVKKWQMTELIQKFFSDYKTTKYLFVIVLLYKKDSEIVLSSCHVAIGNTTNEWAYSEARRQQVSIIWCFGFVIQWQKVKLLLSLQCPHNLDGI